MHSDELMDILVQTPTGTQKLIRIPKKNISAFMGSHSSPANVLSETLHGYKNSSPIPPIKLMASTSRAAATNQIISSVNIGASSNKKKNGSGTDFVNRRRMDKCGKGLRHFSMKVCEKVRNKGVTTYNEVADELVTEFTDPNNAANIGQPYDQKNIRRRVYDALNVLMAMHIISKEKKEIRWLGLPTNSLEECLNLERDKKERIKRIKEKTKQLRETILQQVCLKRLVEHNTKNEEINGGPLLEESLLKLPFLLMRTQKDTIINISVSQDKQEYHIMCDDTFKTLDDVDILKGMGMMMGLDDGKGTFDEIEHAKSLMPEVFHDDIEKMGRGDNNLSMEKIQYDVARTDAVLNSTEYLKEPFSPNSSFSSTMTASCSTSRSSGTGGGNIGQSEHDRAVLGGSSRPSTSSAAAAASTAIPFEPSPLGCLSDLFEAATVNSGFGMSFGDDHVMPFASSSEYAHRAWARAMSNNTVVDHSHMNGSGGGVDVDCDPTAVGNVEMCDVAVQEVVEEDCSSYMSMGAFNDDVDDDECRFIKQDELGDGDVHNNMRSM